MKNKVLIACIATIFLLSCSKESSKDHRLVGTTWCSHDLAYQLIFGGNCFQCFNFYSTTEFEHWRERNGLRVTTFDNRTYVLNYPNLKLSNGTGDCVFTSPSRFKSKIWEEGNIESLSVYYKR